MTGTRGKRAASPPVDSTGSGKRQRADPEVKSEVKRPASPPLLAGGKRPRTELDDIPVLAAPASHTRDLPRASIPRRTPPAAAATVSVSEDSNDGFTPSAPAPSHGTYVKKRDGKMQLFDSSQIDRRIKRAAAGLDIDCTPIIQAVVAQVRPGMRTSQLDATAITECATRVKMDPAYGKLGARIWISDLEKAVPGTYSMCADALRKKGITCKRLANRLAHYGAEYVDGLIDREQNKRFTVFGVDTLATGYLLSVPGPTVRRSDGRLEQMWEMVETPQHMYMRVALMMADGSEADLERLYRGLSQHRFTFATPTMCNLGKRKNANTASCFLVSMHNSVEGIFWATMHTGIFSKFNGGIGFCVSLLTPEGERTSMGAKATGPVSFSHPPNQTIHKVAQGGVRKGAGAAYIDITHPDALKLFLAKKENAKPEDKLDYIQTAVMSRDLFFERVEEDGVWSMFSPKKYPELFKTHNAEYRRRYLELEAQGKYFCQMRAADLAYQINSIRKITSYPYGLNADAINRKSNQSNIGPILLSNLCVAGDTTVLTRHGNLPISSLADQQGDIWNGSEWVPVTPTLTQRDAELMEVTVNNHMTLRCTLDHQFIVVDPKTGEESRVAARDLRRGVQLPTFELPPVDLTGLDPEALVRGYSTGSTLEFSAESAVISYDRAFVAGWIAGLWDSRSQLCHGGEIEDGRPVRGLCMTFNNSVLTHSVVTLLQNLGVRANYLYEHSVNTATGEVTGISHCLALTHAQLVDMAARGIPITTHLPEDTEHDLKFDNLGHVEFNEVTSVRDLGTREDVYCFTEAKNHSAVFNGLLVGQCTEIFEVTCKPPKLFKRLDCMYPVRGLLWAPEDEEDMVEGEDEYDCFSDAMDPAACNLLTISLPAFVVRDADGKCSIDFFALHQQARECIEFEERLFDLTMYPTVGVQRNNLATRPIGLGYQGWQNVCLLLGLRYDSLAARRLLSQVSEVIYHGAVEASIDLAEAHGPYDYYEGSPCSRGLLQFDLWDQEALDHDHVWPEVYHTRGVPSAGPVNWAATKERMRQHGRRHSLLICIPPTASTSQIMNNYEGIDPMTFVTFKRRVLKGEYTVVCAELVDELKRRGLWDYEGKIAAQIEKNKGSVQGLSCIPQDLQELCMTSREITPLDLLKVRLAAAPNVDQGISGHYFARDIDPNEVTTYELHCYHAGAPNIVYTCQGDPDAGSLSVGLNLDAPAVGKEVTVNKEVPPSPPPLTAREGGQAMVIVDESEADELCFIREDGSKTCCQ